MTYLVIAYPKFNKEDLSRIQAYRKIHDAVLFPVIAPHITLVFPVDAISEMEFRNEISALTNQAGPIQLSAGKTIVYKDPVSKAYMSFFVFHKGEPELIALHDRLYSAKLSKELRTDLPYIPHITLGSSADPLVCKQIADDWNATSKNADAVIDQLTIISFKAGIVTPLQVIPLF